MAMRLAQLADRIGAVLAGDGSVAVTGCAAIDSARSDQVTFVANAKYARFLQVTQAAAVIVGPGMACPPGVTRLVADDPYYAFRNAMVELHGFRRHPGPVDEAPGGVSALASVHPDAVVGEGTVVHPHTGSSSPKTYAYIIAKGEGVYPR